MEKTRKWSVEYSISQDCFHVDDLKNVLNINLNDMFLENENTDYKIIAIFDTQDEACKYANKCKRKLEEMRNENI